MSNSLLNIILRSPNGETVVAKVMADTDLKSQVAIVTEDSDILVIADNAAEAARHLVAWGKRRDDGGVYICNI